MPPKRKHVEDDFEFLLEEKEEDIEEAFPLIPPMEETEEEYEQRKRNETVRRYRTREESERQDNPEFNLFGSALAQHRQRQRARELQEHHDRETREDKRRQEEEEWRVSKRNRPFANDWTKRCFSGNNFTVSLSTGISISEILEIGRSHDFDLNLCTAPIAEYLNQFISAVTCDSKIAYFVRTANGHAGFNKTWHSYTSNKTLLQLTEAATHAFSFVVENKKGEEMTKNKVINPMTFWLNYAKRNEFVRLSFVPADHSDPDIPEDVLCPLNEFNIYEGTYITKKMVIEYMEQNPDWKEEADIYDKHIVEVMNSNELDGALFTLNFLAHIIQKPHMKLPVSLRFTGVCVIFVCVYVCVCVCRRAGWWQRVDACSN